MQSSVNSIDKIISSLVKEMQILPYIRIQFQYSSNQNHFDRKDNIFTGKRNADFALHLVPIFI